MMTRKCLSQNVSFIDQFFDICDLLNGSKFKHQTSKKYCNHTDFIGDLDLTR